MHQKIRAIYHTSSTMSFDNAGTSITPLLASFYSAYAFRFYRLIYKNRKLANFRKN
jgi:hypothetical protein